MLFNTDKCKVMKLVNKNPCVKYELGGRELDSIWEEDLGALITKALKVSAQCSRATKTTNRVLGMIRRTFTCKDEQTIMQLYKSLVRPHLEYCVQAWHPYLTQDIEMSRFMSYYLQSRSTQPLLELYTTTAGTLITLSVQQLFDLPAGLSVLLTRLN